MKQNEFKKCANCGIGMAAKNVFFYRVKVEQMVLDISAIQRQQGLEQMMGAAAPIAVALGSDEDLAKCMSTAEILLCGDCGSTTPLIIHMLMEVIE